MGKTPKSDTEDGMHFVAGLSMSRIKLTAAFGQLINVLRQCGL